MDSSQTSFQDLPAELRLMVYSNISPPLTSHLAFALKGLMMSCTTIKAEMEHAVVCNMIKYLDEMKEAWSAAYGTTLRTSTPASVLDVKKGVTVSIPNSFFRLQGQHSMVGPWFPRPLLHLIPLHVDNITVEIYEDEPGTVPLDTKKTLKLHISLENLLGTNESIPLEDGTWFEIPRERLCADSLTVAGNRAFSLWHAIYHGDELHGYWAIDKEDVLLAGAKTWHRLSGARVSRFSEMAERKYARDLPDRH
jgi:hypothetical protein